MPGPRGFCEKGFTLEIFNQQSGGTLLMSAIAQVKDRFQSTFVYMFYIKRKDVSISSPLLVHMHTHKKLTFDLSIVTIPPTLGVIWWTMPLMGPTWVSRGTNADKCISTQLSVGVMASLFSDTTLPVHAPVHVIWRHDLLPSNKGSLSQTCSGGMPFDQQQLFNQIMYTQ